MRLDPEEARTRWIRLDEETRQQIVKGAGKGRRAPSEELAEVALGWAWAVLGPPWQRRRHPWYRYMLSLIANSGNKGMFYWGYMRGLSDYDLVPVVRRAARTVERANWPGDLARPDVTDR